MKKPNNFGAQPRTIPRSSQDESQNFPVGCKRTSQHLLIFELALTEIAVVNQHRRSRVSVPSRIIEVF